MQLDFDLNTIDIVTFGIGNKSDDDISFYEIPIDANIRSELTHMIKHNFALMAADEDRPLPYETSEKYSSTEYLILDIEDNGIVGRSVAAQRYMKLNTALNVRQWSPSILDDMTSVFCYFARFRDGDGRRITAFRRAMYFKGILKSKNLLMKIVDDSLASVEDRLLKLDHDFDFVVDSGNFHIWRPGAFDIMANVGMVVMQAASRMVHDIESRLSFVRFDNIMDYASTHSRAARYLNSIRSQNLEGIECQHLIKQCQETGVTVEEIDGSIVVPDESVIGFLEVLDRRRYVNDLVPNNIERYRASSRQRL